MLTAEKCRIYAAKSHLLGSVIVPTEQSVHHSKMSLKWIALADQLDLDNVEAIEGFGNRAL